MVNAIDGAAQLASHALKIGWYYGINRLVDREMKRHGATPRRRPERAMPNSQELFNDIRTLLREDAAAVAKGIYPPLAPQLADTSEHLGRLRLMFADLPHVLLRREGQQHDTAHAAADDAGLPEYFRQDFHFQTGGYLTAESARLYDIQVETLFYGSAELMRRAALAPIAEALRGRDQRRLSLLDVACGTGRFLRCVRLAYPALRLTGLDLSRPYIDEAIRHLGALRPATFIAANAEAIPLPDASQDLVTSIFLFHELPPPVRRLVTREMVRVLKPGGMLIFVDSLQMGDRPDWDGLLEAFPERFHEPYFRHYAIDDLRTIFTAAGLTIAQTRLAFLAKMMVMRKA